MSDRDARIARAREMRRDGKLHREIADALGVCMATASAWARNLVSYCKHPTGRRKNEVLPLINRLYREGHSIPDIARITGVPQSTLFDWRRELGLPKNSRAVYVTDEMRAQISKSLSRDPDGEAKEWAAKFYVENLLSTPEIAAILHVTSVTVSAWLKKLKVRTRTEPLLRTRERLREANLGAKRWNWKGGITPDRVRLRTSLEWNLLTLCKRCHDAFHNAAGGAVRMAIGPFFSNTNEVRDFPVSSEYPVAA
jgi:transposase